MQLPLATLLSLVPLTLSLPQSHPLDLRQRDTAQTPDLGFASGSMRSYSNISFGFLPDYNMPSPRMGTLNADTGKKAAMYGYYSQITSSSYDDSQITNQDTMNDIKNSGAVFAPSIMPTGLTWDEITDDVADQIGNTVRKFTDQGIRVFLRFAHEMSYYAVDPNADPKYPGGQDYSAFISAWQRVHSVCASNSLCLMWWCPNRGSVSDVSPWWPGENYVDIIGIDWYADDGETFSGSLSEFYDNFPKKYNKHFILGETGTSSDDSPGAKEQWLKEVASVSQSDFPNYQGAMWFEYYKGDYDFRIVYGQSQETVTETLSNFA